MPYNSIFQATHNTAYWWVLSLLVFTINRSQTAFSVFPLIVFKLNVTPSLMENFKINYRIIWPVFLYGQTCFLCKGHLAFILKHIHLMFPQQQKNGTLLANITSDAIAVFCERGSTSRLGLCKGFCWFNWKWAVYLINS